jgi:hypothetical protein
MAISRELVARISGLPYSDYNEERIGSVSQKLRFSRRERRQARLASIPPVLTSIASFATSGVFLESDIKHAAYAGVGAAAVGVAGLIAGRKEFAKVAELGRKIRNYKDDLVDLKKRREEPLPKVNIVIAFEQEVRGKAE